MSEPVFNAPRSVVVAILVLALVHAVLAYLPEGQQVWWQLALAFIPARFAGFAADLPGGELAIWTSFLTHQLVHGDLAHLMINAAWLLAFGSAVAERIGVVRFVLFGALSGAAGALLFLAVRFGEAVPVVGASGAISGLMGAAFRFFFTALEQGGLGRFRTEPTAIPLMPLRETLFDRRVQAATGLFVLANLLIGLVGTALTSGGGIAWQAHLGGYFFGLLTFGLIDRPHPRARSDGWLH
jgi:membrane associated rhomboid family serine protease